MSEQRLNPKAWRADVLLDAVPVSNDAVREERQDGLLVLHVPIRKTWYNSSALSIILPFRSQRGFALDQLGESVWRACDGQQTVEQMIEAFAQTQHIRFHEARLLVVRFLQMLVQRKLAVLVFPEATVEALRKQGVEVPS